MPTEKEQRSLQLGVWLLAAGRFLSFMAPCQNGKSGEYSEVEWFQCCVLTVAGVEMLEISQ